MKKISPVKKVRVNNFTSHRWANIDRIFFFSCGRSGCFRVKYLRTIHGSHLTGNWICFRHAATGWSSGKGRKRVETGIIFLPKTEPHSNPTIDPMYLMYMLALSWTKGKSGGPVVMMNWGSNVSKKIGMPIIFHYSAINCYISLSTLFYAVLQYGGNDYCKVNTTIGKILHPGLQTPATDHRT